MQGHRRKSGLYHQTYLVKVLVGAGLHSLQRLRIKCAPRLAGHDDGERPVETIVMAGSRRRALTELKPMGIGDPLDLRRGHPSLRSELAPSAHGVDHLGEDRIGSAHVARAGSNRLRIN